MTALYNEIEPFAADWLGNLSAAGHIARGDVDRRSIAELKPEDIDGYKQFHTFAGIGAWSYALRLAGWSDGAPVWTGSCPCQPFSTAGKRLGTSDERHLWPEWRRLIAECRPPILFGEQVASPDGRAWLASVRSDLETLGYRVGAADLCAAGVGAPHIRQRLFFGAVRLENTDLQRRQGERIQLRQRTEGPKMPEATRRGKASGWSDAEYIACKDGRARPTEPGIHPLAHGAPSRVGRLRAYGNAIVPQVAAHFIAAFIEAAEDQ